MNRLRIIVRDDLGAGPTAAQAVHAAIAWQAAHVEAAARWREESETVAVLAAPS